MRREEVGRERRGEEPGRERRGDETRKVRVIQWGVGAMGSLACRLILERPDLELVGAISHQDGQDLGLVIGLGRDLGLSVRSDPDEVLGRVPADVLLLMTCSLTKDVFPQIMKGIEHGLFVITSAEEMAYPHVREPELARRIDESARAKGVAVLGTGINPGFSLDKFIITLLSVCHRVDRVWASRVNDLSPYGPSVMASQGVGVTPEEYRVGVREGRIAGHIGFRESITMIADSLGWELDEITESREPVVTRVVRETPHVRVLPGQTAGTRQVGRGFLNGREVITLEHPQEVRPELEGTSAHDHVRIEGVPTIDLTVTPEISGGYGTTGLCVNMIHVLLRAEPGLRTMRELPLMGAPVGGFKA